MTGYEKYAVEAFKVKAHGYLLKPLDVEEVKEVKEELAYLPGQIYAGIQLGRTDKCKTTV